MKRKATIRVNRREMLGVMAGAAGLALTSCASPTPSGGTQTPSGAPSSAPAGKTLTWKVQSAWPTAHWQFANLKHLAEKIQAMSGGRLTMELLGAGAVVPAADDYGAVHNGLLDACHSHPAWHTGQEASLALFGTAAGGPFGLHGEDFLAWMHFGGGIALYNEILQQHMKLDVVMFPAYGQTPEGFGWYQKPIKTKDDLKGLKFRAAGLTSEVFKELGAAVVGTAPGEVVPALERGTLDATEYSDPVADYAAGIYEVRKYYELPGVHQLSGMHHLVVSKKNWNALPKDLQAIVEFACMAETLHFGLRTQVECTRILDDLVNKHGVTIVETPKDLQVDVLEAWDAVVERRSKESAIFAKVVASQKEFARKQVNMRRLVYAPYDVTADHYWRDDNPYKSVKP